MPLRTKALRFAIGLAAAAASLPVVGLLFSAAPIASRALVALAWVLAAARPADSLLLVAAAAPLGGVIGALLGAPFGLGEPLVLAFLGGWLASETRTRATTSARARSLLWPAIAVAVVATASSVVWVAALQPFVAFPLQFVGRFARFVWSDYFLDPNSFSPLTAGMLIVEGMGLFAATVIMSDRQPRVARAVMRVTVLAASGVAVLNLNRVATVALRSGEPGATLLRLISSERISAAFPDFNAAGSYLAMALLGAAGLALANGRARRSWTLPLVAIGLALWLTASRAAMLAVPAASLAALFLLPSVRRLLRPGRRILVAGVCVIALVGVMLFAARGPTRISIAEAAEGRLALAGSAARMIADYPVFGVGMGRFQPLSKGYLAPEFREVIGRENAHNNFLQILAELGLAGFLPFAWLLVSAGRSVWRSFADQAVDTAFTGMAAGLAAFLLTCLFGHPLLIREVAYPFWAALGTCAAFAGLDAVRPGGEATSNGIGRAQKARVWLPRAAVLLLVVTLPFRVQSALSNSDLTAAAIGLSNWTPDVAGILARQLTGSVAQFFIPGDVRGVRLPFLLQSTAGDDAEDVDLVVDGKLISRLRLRTGSWTHAPLVLPVGTGFRCVHVLRGNAAASRTVWVGEPVLGERAGPRTPGDFNGDRQADLVWRHTNGQNVVWLMKDGSFRSQLILPGEPDRNWEVAAVVDANGDGRPDLLWRNRADGRNAVWYLRGATLLFQALLPPQADTNWRMAAAEARDGDSEQRVFWRNTSNGRNVVWHIDGPKLLSTSELDAVPDQGWQIAGTADFDGDGRADLVWRNEKTGENLVWYMAEDKILGKADLPASPSPSWQLAAVGDFVGDRKPDVVLRNCVTGENALWELEGVKLRRQLELPAIADLGWRLGGSCR